MYWRRKNQTDNDNNAFKGNNDGLRSKMRKMFRILGGARTEDLNYDDGRTDGYSIAQRIKSLELQNKERDIIRVQERMMRDEHAINHATAVMLANKENVNRAQSVLERTKRELIAANTGDAVLERGYRSTPELKNVVLWKDSELLWKGSEHLPEENPAEFISSVAQMGGSDKKTVREKIQKMLSWKKKKIELRKGLTSIPDREVKMKRRTRSEQKYGMIPADNDDYE